MAVAVVICLLLVKPAALAVAQVATQPLQVVHRLPRAVGMALQVVQVPTGSVFMPLVAVAVVPEVLALLLYSIRNQALTVALGEPALSRVHTCCMPVVVVVVLTVQLVGQMAHLVLVPRAVAMVEPAQTGLLLA